MEYVLFGFSNDSKSLPQVTKATLRLSISCALLKRLELLWGTFTDLVIEGIEYLQYFRCCSKVVPENIKPLLESEDIRFVLHVRGTANVYRELHLAAGWTNLP